MIKKQYMKAWGLYGIDDIRLEKTKESKIRENEMAMLEPI
jgi:subtilase family serine protease